MLRSWSGRVGCVHKKAQLRGLGFFAELRCFRMHVLKHGFFSAFHIINDFVKAKGQLHHFLNRFLTFGHHTVSSVVAVNYLNICAFFRNFAPCSQSSGFLALASLIMMRAVSR